MEEADWYTSLVQNYTHPAKPITEVTGIGYQLYRPVDVPMEGAGAADGPRVPPNRLWPRAPLIRAPPPMTRRDCIGFRAAIRARPRPLVRRATLTVNSGLCQGVRSARCSRILVSNGGRKAVGGRPRRANSGQGEGAAPGGIDCFWRGPG